MGWPFLAPEALAAELIPERAMRSLYSRVYPRVYAPRGVDLTAAQRARAAWLWSGRRGVVAGNSAAALLGARWVDPLLPAELIHRNRRPPPMVVVHSETLLDGETVMVDGVAVTSPARTGFDIGRRLPRALAIEGLDALANATDVKITDIETVIAHHPGMRGLSMLHRILPLVDGGAESPRETRTRLVLIDAGLPTPRTQIPVFNEFGDFVARIDMGWEEWLVGVEYDGAQHWTDRQQRTRDIDRTAQLEAVGWTIVRVDNDLLNYRRGTVISRVSEALRVAGWSG
jgi:hypothetical protein